MSMVTRLFSSLSRDRFSVFLGESYIADASKLNRRADTIDSRRCLTAAPLVPTVEAGKSTLPRFMNGNACRSMFGVFEPLLMYRLFLSD